MTQRKRQRNEAKPKVKCDSVRLTYFQASYIFHFSLFICLSFSFSPSLPFPLISSHISRDRSSQPPNASHLIFGKKSFKTITDNEISELSSFLFFKAFMNDGETSRVLNGKVVHNVDVPLL